MSDRDELHRLVDELIVKCQTIKLLLAEIGKPTA